MRSVAYLVIALTLAQYAQAQEPTAEQLQYFEQKVRPLLVAKCFECHSSSSEKLNGGLKLDSREAIFAGGDNGPALVAGQPEASLLIKAVQYSEAGFEMPPSGKLKPHEIEVFETWVKLGAPYPATVTKETTRREIDIEAGKRHWAFQPLAEHIVLPAASTWAQNRIDAFIHASSRLTIIKLSQRQHRPSCSGASSSVCSDCHQQWKSWRRSNAALIRKRSNCRSMPG